MKKKGINTAFSCSLKKEGDKLMHIRRADELQYKELIKLIPEGQLIDLFIDVHDDSGNLAQLAKLHKCIRELAKMTGTTFEEMKLVVKKRSGLLFVKHQKDREPVLVEYSFGKCSSEDLSLAIETCMELGDKAGGNLR